MSKNTKKDIQSKVVTNPAVKIELQMQYVFDATDGNVTVLYKDIAGNVLKAVDVYIPPEIYGQWSSTDDTILDYIYQQIGVTKL